MSFEEGQVAVVTGGARAIGREISETLARAGATVVSFDLSDSAEMVAAVEAAGGTAAGIECDVTDEARVQASVAEVVERFGRIDVLVNNAGIFSTMARRSFWEMPVEEWDLMMRVNVRSVFLVSKAASGPMREAGRGRIVNIASNVFVFGMPQFLHYVASKGAVVGITRGMARELGPHGIAVNAVSPGLVTTEITEETVPAEYRKIVADGQCLTEPLVPSDIAQAVMYLASPAARLISGQNLLVNGGATMGPS